MVQNTTKVGRCQVFNDLVEKRLGRQVSVVGVAIESDTHTVGIDAIFNAKGFAG